jgi:phosphoglycolate phosphatase-like HAD superfamily hydrolase
MQHVVWDWNGTLFDDLHVVIDAVNEGLTPLGVGPITLDVYRSHYTRPVKLFYDRLMGRDISEEEWVGLDARFHDGYRRMLERAQPNAGAVAALDLMRSQGVRQSLLSMFPHGELIPLVTRLGLDSYFDRIDGLRGVPGDTKAAYLEAHLRLLTAGEDPSGVLVVGDTPDDAVAAAHVGARCVLFDNGAHHRHELEGCGVPVVASLLEAVSLRW